MSYWYPDTIPSEIEYLYKLYSKFGFFYYVLVSFDDFF